MMTNDELQALVEKISLADFQQPFCHQAIFNPRLKTTGGRYHLQDHHLDFNPTILEDAGLDVFTGVIKHELCHYHLHLAHKGYRHTDTDFQQLLAKTGGLRYAPTLQSSKYSYTYECQRCGLVYQRKRKVDTKKYRCGTCQGQLQQVRTLL